MDFRVSNAVHLSPVFTEIQWSHHEHLLVETVVDLGLFVWVQCDAWRSLVCFVAVAVKELKLSYHNMDM